jgi:hypothetical protein
LKNKGLRKSNSKGGGLTLKALPINFITFIFLFFNTLFVSVTHAKPMMLPVELIYSSAEEFKYLTSGIINMIESRLAVQNTIVPRVGESIPDAQMKAKINIALHPEKASYQINIFKENKLIFSASEALSPQEFISKFSSDLNRARNALIEESQKIPMLGQTTPKNQDIKEIEKRGLKDKITSGLSKLNPVTYIVDLFFKDKDRLFVKIDIIPPPPPPPTQSFLLFQSQPYPQIQPKISSPTNQPYFIPPSPPSPPSLPTPPPSNSPWQWF